MATKKKRFTFADAKDKIKDLEQRLEAANVQLDDNVVTNDELWWLRIYKTGFWVLLALSIIGHLL